MAKKRMVMRIFWRSSLMRQMVTSRVWPSALRTALRRTRSQITARTAATSVTQPTTPSDSKNPVIPDSFRIWAPAGRGRERKQSPRRPDRGLVGSWLFALAGLHLVPHRLLGRRDHLRGPALGGDLLG